MVCVRGCGVRCCVGFPFMFAPPGLCVCVPSWITDDKKPAGGQGSWQLTLANEARLPGGKESQTWDSVPVAVRLFPLVPWAPKMVLFAFSFLLLPREAKCLSSANEASRDKCVVRVGACRVCVFVRVRVCVRVWLRVWVRVHGCVCLFSRNPFRCQLQRETDWKQPYYGSWGQIWLRAS